MEINKNELEARALRGAEIQRFLENETVKAVFMGLEVSYFTAWKSAETPADREQLHATVRAFDDLTTALQGVVDAGTLATQELEGLEQDT